MKSYTIITDELENKRYVQVDFSALKAARKKGSSIREFFEDLEDMIDAELSRSEKGEDWEDVKKRLKKKGVLSEDL